MSAATIILADNGSTISPPEGLPTVQKKKQEIIAVKYKSDFTHVKSI